MCLGWNLCPGICFFAILRMAAVFSGIGLIVLVCRLIRCHTYLTFGDATVMDFSRFTLIPSVVSSSTSRDALSSTSSLVGPKSSMSSTHQAWSHPLVLSDALMGFVSLFAHQGLPDQPNGMAWMPKAPCGVLILIHRWRAGWTCRWW